MSWDPYSALGVSRSSTADDIRRAYRKLAKELHPDVRPGDRSAEERFKRATAAFNLLSDPASKGRFDRGEIDADGNERMAFGGRPRQGARAHAGAGAGADAFDLGDIFSDLFGSGFGNGGGTGGARSYSRMRGRDVRFTLDVDFLDSIVGAKRRISLAEGRTVDVNIPAGVDNGQVMRLKGQGGAGVQGGMPGDALVELKVRPHPFFRREGQSVLMDLNVSLTEAVEGGRVEVPTPSGKVWLTIPPGANTGNVLRLKGKGVAGQGDQLIRLQVMLPETPDEDLRKFTKKWGKRDYVPQRPQS